MKAERPIIGMGIIVIISGIVFYLQGQSLVGPKSSFMYSNPQWNTNGQWIVIVGIIILVSGIAIFKVNLRHPK